MLRLLVKIALTFCAMTVVFAATWILVATPDGKVMTSAVPGVLDSPVLFLQLLYFVFVYVTLHVAVAVVWFLVWQPLAVRFGGDRKTARDLGILSFLGVLLWIILLNGEVNPGSIFAADYDPGFARIAATSVLWLITLYLGVAVVYSLSLRIRGLFAGGMPRRWPVAGGMAGMLVAGTVVLGPEPGAAVAERSEPDVLFIGVDSLRVDHIGASGTGETSLTPNLDRLLQGSAVVSRTWTPLARTFPAWMSVFTGRYPSGHGAVYNLVQRGRVDDSNSLPGILGQLGYERVYAIDESRFSNIDRSYGFDRVLAPPIGAADFIIGTVNDLPLVNLVVNTPPGKFLFPNIYMNRAIHDSYRPEAFSDEIDAVIATLDPEKPLFLVAHFELPHWPYLWAGVRGPDVDLPEDDRSLPVYRAALQRADEQLGALVRTLEASGRMRNALVVVLSDHGESFWTTEPIWDAPATHEFTVDRYGGHGTNVLSERQYRVLLAFKGFGPVGADIEPGPFDAFDASLVDVYPTLLDLLGLAPPGEMDGMSLAPWLRDRGVPAPDQRLVTIESGFSLPSIERGNPDAAAVVAEGARYYQVGVDGRLTIAEEWLPFLLTQKQRAVVSGRWSLAAYSASVDGADWHLLFADLDDFRLWDVRDPGTLPPGVPVEAMLAELCTRFAGTAEFDLPECREIELRGIRSTD